MADASLQHASSLSPNVKGLYLCTSVIFHDEEAHTIPPVIRAFVSWFVPSFSRLQENKLSFVINLRTFEPHSYCTCLLRILTVRSFMSPRHHTSSIKRQRQRKKYKQAYGCNLLS